MEDLIKAGKIFIYPTDTIYGIGCDATNAQSVQRILAIKKRNDKAFSVIPPSNEWIRENIATDKTLSWGPYTYFVIPQNPDCVAPGVQTDQSLGLRMSKHWFTEHITRAGVPFISTSVNISGKPYMTSLENLDPEIKNLVDVIIYEGPKASTVSTKIDLTKQG